MNKSSFDIVKCDNKTISYGISTITLCLVLIIIFVVYKTFIKPIDFQIPEDDDNLSYRRESNRGMLAGLITAVTFGTMNVFINSSFNINLATSTALLSLLLGNTIGFLIDNSIATNIGLKNFQVNGYISGIRGMFTSLSSERFIRFGLTVLMDTFIALIVLKPVYEWLIKQAFFKCTNFTKSIANGLLSAGLALITFNAYTRQNRVYWKNPNLKTADRVMPSSTILLANIVLAIIFLKSDTGEKIGINNPKVKLLLVYIVLCLTSIFYMIDVSSPKIIDDAKDKIKNVFKNVPRHMIGKIIFCLISFICIFGTFATSSKNNKWITASIITGIFSLFALTDGFGSIVRYFKELIGLPTENIINLEEETSNIINSIKEEVNNEIKKEIDN